ncbi:response regulator transcription factor [Roseibacterium sp. KMU-115]|uniref:Response regulator transcription factor n=1 Tax=Roseicyclus persicicus TaxID=2650661 RepID=A0A7X6GVR1_9RHOB|nr:response regulator transcription factor [Roseibacterium persicicum]
MKLIIADDHVLLGQAVAATLKSEDHYDVAVAKSLPELLAALKETSFDIVMLDLKMPGMVGLPSVKQVCEATGDGNVVLFTGQVDRRFVADCQAIGVTGHIPKDLPLRSLDSALQLIHSGQPFLPIMASPDPAAADLTDRELHILRLAADGMTNKEIARDIAVSEVSIKMHMRNICRKLGARNRAHAAIIGRELLLI